MAKKYKRQEKKYEIYHVAQQEMKEKAQIVRRLFKRNRFLNN